MHPKKGFYSLSEVCVRLKINRRTVTRWIEKRILTPHVPGKRHVFFRIKEVERLWNGRA